MKKTLAFIVLMVIAAVCSAQTTPTPNIGLLIPANGSTDWNVPLTYNFNLLDQLLSGKAPQPFLNVSTGYQIGGSYGAAGSVLASTGTGSHYVTIQALLSGLSGCSTNGYVLTADGAGGFTCTPVSGTGTVTTFSAPSGNWPAWLVPTVSNATTTPSLNVTASAIPNSALQYPSITINSTSCTLGGSCTITAGGSGTVTSFSAPSGSWPSFLIPAVTNGTTTPALTVTFGTLPVGYGGTGATTAQSAINALAGGVTAGKFLRGDGTNIALSFIQAADIPNNAANTSGNAGTATKLSTTGSNGQLWGIAGGVQGWINSATVAPTSLSYTFYVSAGTTYAVNNSTQAVVHSGTDAAVVINAVLSDAASTGATLVFKPGTYNLNSATQETQGGYSLFYSVGIPYVADTTTRPSFRFVGESNQYGAGWGTSQGAIFAVSTAAETAAGAGNTLVAFWARPNTSYYQNGIYWGSPVYFQDISVEFPNNTRGKEIAIDGLEASYLELQNVAMLFVTDPGAVGASGLTAVISPATPSSGVRIVNSYAQPGWDTGFEIDTEHSYISNSQAFQATTGFKYGYQRNRNNSPVYHSGLWDHAECYDDVHCIVSYDANVAAGAQLDVHLDLEYTNTGPWTYADGFTTGSNLGGFINWTNILTLSGLGVLSTPFPSGSGGRYQFHADGVASVQKVSLEGQAADPTSSSGDLWYNKTTNRLMANINSVPSPISTPPPETHSGSAVSSLDFTSCLSSSFDNYEIRFTITTVGGSGNPLGLRFSGNGGSTWDTGASYHAGRYFVGVQNDSSNVVQAGTSGTVASVTGNDTDTPGSGLTYAGFIRVYGVNSSANKLLTGQSTGNVISGSDAFFSTFGGSYVSSGAINAVQLAYPSSTFTGSATCAPLNQ